MMVRISAAESAPPNVVAAALGFGAGAEGARTAAGDTASSETRAHVGSGLQGLDLLVVEMEDHFIIPRRCSRP